MALHVGRSPLCHGTPRLVVVLLQPVIALKGRAQLGERAIRLERLVHRVPFRVDLVDRDVKMKVVGVVMHRADTLMLAVAETGTNTFLDGFQSLGGRTLAGTEADKQVKRLVAGSTGVLPLGGKHFADDRLHSGSLAVRRGDLSKPFR